MALETSLIHSWRLNGDCLDNKGTYDGSATSITYTTGRKTGECAVFSGSGDISTNHLDYPSGVNAISTAFWFKMNTEKAVSQVIFAFGAGSPPGNCYIVYIAANDTGHTGELAISQNGSAVWSGSRQDNNLWHFGVITASGDATPTYIVYVDGVSAASGAMATNRGIDGSYIGTLYSDRVNLRFTGNIQDVCLWSKELTPTEVTQLWNYGEGMYFDGSIFQSYGGAGFLSTNKGYW